MKLKYIIGFLIGYPNEKTCLGIRENMNDEYVSRYPWWYWKFFYRQIVFHKPGQLLCRLLYEDSHILCKLFGHDINAIELELFSQLEGEQLEKRKKDPEFYFSNQGARNLGNDSDLSSLPSLPSKLPIRCKRGCK